MSIHIEAKKGEIADRILLPGDPLRAKFIAENWFENPVCFNNVRGMLGFTGTWKGERLSVMGTGMGMPSHGIYVNELLNEYGVRKLIRVGTCGATREEIAVRDVILAMSASTDANINRQRFGFFDYAPTASYELLAKAHAAGAGKTIHVGAIASVDSFYHPQPDAWKLWAEYGILGLEMETAELYTLAARKGAQALAILTVSDHLVTGASTSSAERQSSFRDMIDMALTALV